MIFVILTIVIISVVLAVVSLHRQTKLQEIKKARKDLKRQKVIFYFDKRT